MWEGIDIAVVKAEWSEELGGFAKNPEAIKRALEHLPVDWPPNVAQFKALCIGREGDIEQSQPRLPGPIANIAKVREIISKIPRLQAKRPPKQWAEDLRKREQKIDRSMSIAQRAAWREALLASGSEPAVASGIRIISDDKLPPGMRRVA
jgi:hypothetical protein